MAASPSLRALRAFQAAATHDRLADAARTLGITDSAISHQIRQVEGQLHVKLFERTAGGLRLTDSGARYLARIEPALRALDEAAEAIRSATGRPVVRLTLPPSLAATWLIPRLAGFEAAHVDIEVQIVATTRVVDLIREQIDLAIRYGAGDWPGLEVSFLFADLATAVAAPGVMDGLDLRAADVLTKVRLIVNRSIPGEWDEWARARGLTLPDRDRALTLDSIEQVLRVAEAGHGLAMGRAPYVSEPLARGTLVAPFGDVEGTGAAYHLCRPSAHAPTAATRTLIRWLQAQAAT